MGQAQQIKEFMDNKIDDQTYNWLSFCVIGEVRDIDSLIDLVSLLHEVELIECEVKYIEGLRYLLECPSHDMMLKLLEDGKDSLTKWKKDVPKRGEEDGTIKSAA